MKVHRGCGGELVFDADGYPVACLECGATIGDPDDDLEDDWTGPDNDYK